VLSVNLSHQRWVTHRRILMLHVTLQQHDNIIHIAADKVFPQINVFFNRV
jgi:hypothetical protein